MAVDDYDLDEYDIEVLERLLELQHIDTRIGHLQHKLDHLDAQQALDDVEEELAAVREEYEGHRVDLDRAEAEQRKIEGQIDVLTERKDAEHARMYSGDISNPKELQSLRAEIESVEKRIEQQEDQLLKVMEVVDELEGTMAELDEREQQLQLRIEELTEARDAAAKDLLAERAELEGDRENHVEVLPDELLQRYEEAVEANSGVGVAELDGGMCTGCRIELPMVDREELYEGPPLGICPQCGRLLVVP